MVKNLINQVNFEYEHLESGDVVSVAGTFGIGDRVDLPSIDLEYDYDKHGNRTSLIDGDEVTTYEYDHGLRLSKITNHIDEEFIFGYDDKNRITSITRPGSVTIYDFYDNNILKKITHSNNSGIINEFDYVVNGIGNITQKRTPAGNFDYGYDGNNQLTSATDPETLNDEIFSYDSLGNRITDKNGNYVYDQTGQKLQEDWKNLYYYDDNGNLSSKIEKSSNDVHQYIYNSENRLIEYGFFKGGTVKEREAFYTFDALGRRIEKVVNDIKNNTSKTRRYVYDGEDILLVLDQNNERLAKYTHSSLRVDDVLSIDVSQAGQDAGVAKTKGSYQFLKDHLGSVVDITDSQGNLKQKYSYSSFGVISKVSDKDGNDITSSPELESHFTYTGRELDNESGLYHYRARAYDAEAGRFMQIDPHEGSLQTPSSFINKYIYTLNNPVELVDPMGLFGIWLSVAAGSLLGYYDPYGVVSGSIAFAQRNRNKILGAALIATGIVITTGSGGAAAPVGGALVGAGVALYNTDNDAGTKETARNIAIGAAIGAAVAAAPSIGTKIVVGALTGALTSSLTGGNTEDNISHAKNGAITGGISGATSGGSTSSGAGNSGNQKIDWAGGRLIKR